jgi:hypothetical protein
VAYSLGPEIERIKELSNKSGNDGKAVIFVLMIVF